MNDDPWLDYLQITQHPFLDRFENDFLVEGIYERAVNGYPPGYMHRPDHWYGQVTSTQQALDRLGEFVESWLEVATDSAKADYLKMLEDCEEPESIDLIERIMNHYKQGRWQTAPALTRDDGLASEKQRALLRRLGHGEFAGTKGEASALIDKLLEKK